QPASLRCEFCLRDFGNIGALACHKKFQHPPGTPIPPTTIQVTFPRNKKRQRDTSPTPERENREKVQCGVCQKFYAHLDSLVIHCRKFHYRQGMSTNQIPPQRKIQDNKNKRPSGISLPLMRSSVYMSKSGLTLHLVSRHGYQPTHAHQSTRRMRRNSSAPLVLPRSSSTASSICDN
ncbi:uncharacterized protein TM35_000062740, partial [Trypanosoma theileri]